MVRTKEQNHYRLSESDERYLRITYELSTDYCDIASMISLRSVPDMNFLMGRVRTWLDTLVPVLKQEEIDGVPATPVTNYHPLRFQMELNLAFAYSVLIHTQGATALLQL